MQTRIEVSDTFLENARSTAEAEINPPAPLKVWFFCGGAVTSGYIDFKTGLSSLMESVCKNPQYVRKLEIKLVLEKDEVKGDAGFFNRFLYRQSRWWAWRRFVSDSRG